MTFENCLNISKYTELCEKINNDKKLNYEEKQFLILACAKFIEYNYSNISDLYNSKKVSNQVKTYLKELRLVIVDDDSLIETGLFNYTNSYSKYVNRLVGRKDEK